MKKSRSIIFLMICTMFIGFSACIRNDEFTSNKSVDSMKESIVGNITFHYNDEEDSKKSIDLIKKIIPQANKYIEGIISNSSKENLNVILYDNNQELLKVANGLSNINGLYIPASQTIHIINYNKDLAEWEYEELFLHEYGHYKFDSFIKQNEIKTSSIPIWFIEGFAEYIKHNGAEVLYSPLSISKKKDLKSLNSSQDFEQARKEKYNPYLQSYYAVDELIRTNQPEVLENIILKSKDTNFYEAFKLVTNMNFDEFEKVYLKKEEDDYNNRLKK